MPVFFSPVGTCVISVRGIGRRGMGRRGMGRRGMGRLGMGRRDMGQWRSWLALRFGTRFFRFLTVGPRLCQKYFLCLLLRFRMILTVIP